MPKLEFPPELIPLAFRRPDEARRRAEQIVAEAHGRGARLGRDVRLRIMPDLIDVPHTAMWTGPTDAEVVRATRDLIALLHTYDPEPFRSHIGNRSPEFRRLYLGMTAIRVAQLCDALAAKGFTSGSILEVGALFGSFALPLQRLGYKVTAVDRYNSFGGSLDGYVRLLRSEGVEVVSTTREDEERALAQLPVHDGVISMAVVEHIPHTPRLFLEYLRSRAKPGGILAMDTPNLVRYWNRRRFSEGKSVFMDLAMQYECEIPFEGHHREYTPEEMTWLMQRIGCEDVAVSLFDYNMLQFERIDRPHIDCLISMLECPDTSGLILVCGRTARISSGAAQPANLSRAQDP